MIASSMDAVPTWIRSLPPMLEHHSIALGQVTSIKAAMPKEHRNISNNKENDGVTSAVEIGWPFIFTDDLSSNGYCVPIATGMK
jgi:hypothetical protein